MSESERDPEQDNDIVDSTVFAFRAGLGVPPPAPGSTDPFDRFIWDAHFLSSIEPILSRRSRELGAAQMQSFLAPKVWEIPRRPHDQLVNIKYAMLASSMLTERPPFRALLSGICDDSPAWYKAKFLALWLCLGHRQSWSFLGCYDCRALYRDNRLYPCPQWLFPFWYLLVFGLLFGVLR